MANKTKYYYLATSAQDRVNAINILLANGFRWHNHSSYLNGEMVEREYSYRNYPIVVIELTVGQLGGWNPNRETTRAMVMRKNLSKLQPKERQ